MRFLVLYLVLLISAISIIYKWRYKLLNIILAVGFLRKIGVKLTMKMPSVRSKMIPRMFSN